MSRLIVLAAAPVMPPLAAAVLPLAPLPLLAAGPAPGAPEEAGALCPELAAAPVTAGPVRPELPAPGVAVIAVVAEVALLAAAPVVGPVAG